MLVQEHIRQLVALAAPHLAYATTPEQLLSFQAEHSRLVSQIKPIKFGNVALWTAATTYTLAAYQVPRDGEYNIVMRVECYTVNLTSGATDYGVIQPPPPGNAYWQITPAGTGNSRIVTDQTMQSHVMLDVDEFKIFSQGEMITLIGDFNVSPDGNTRNVRTLVYSYNVGKEIVERIGGIDILEPPSTGV